MPIVSSQEWDQFVAQNKQAHLLQTSYWGQLKSEFGWSAVPIIRGNSGVQLLLRKLPLGFSMAYIPKGIPGDGFNDLMPEIDAFCKKHRAIALKLEPDLWEDDPRATIPEGFHHSSHSIQPARTITIDLQHDDDTLLARMKQKTRYNIRLGLRKGVVIANTGDVVTFNKLMETTGERDAFGVHSADYYQRVYELFHPRDMCVLLMAEVEGRPLAGLMMFMRGDRAWYFYGASSNEHRNFMPTYVLQWEAIRLARTNGCKAYDLWGIPDKEEEILEAEFAGRSDGLWGVYRFKRGFGGQIRRHAGPWDRIYNPLVYRAYETWIART